MDLYWGGPERRITGLTLRILGVNALALLILVIGLLYLGQYQNTLIEDKLKAFQSDVEIIASSVEHTLPSKVKTKALVGALANTLQHNIQVFGRDGQEIANAFTLLPSELTERWTRFSPSREPLSSVRMLKDMAESIIQTLPGGPNLPPYPGKDDISQEAMQASSQEVLRIGAWQDGESTIILSAAFPIFAQDGSTAGAILLTRPAGDIKESVAHLWLDVLRIFLVSLLITILLSIYLSGLIARPLKNLAKAAEAVRKGKANADAIPDLSGRHDEIGDLSLVIRAMTRALLDRMDTIDRFAADVAHELKNPLTSMRSAIETASIVKTKKDQNRMFEILRHDIDRLDRLITDISQASRLDAELSRERFQPIDLKDFMRHIIGRYKDPDTIQKEHGQSWNNETIYQGIRIRIEMLEGENFIIQGVENRLAQVLNNLIENALSFSEEGQTITVRLHKPDTYVQITVDDEGPGIPESKLEDIFKRFYTERPEGEAYGNHSGLGLAICKQIINAHRGTIEAKNIYDVSNTISGARFTISLKSYEQEKN